VALVTDRVAGDGATADALRRGHGDVYGMVDWSLIDAGDVNVGILGRAGDTDVER
jgi:hypothetical protein